MFTKSLALLVATGALFIGGCASTSATDEGKSASVSDGSAVACDKCQTTFARVPVMSGNPRAHNGVVAYRTVSKHECPECRNVATEVLQQGKATTPGEVVHKCKICGGEMTVCHAS